MVADRRAQPAPWATEGEDKRTAVQRMFSDIAPTYDRCNALMSLRLHHRWRSFAAKQLRLQPGMTVLDLCSGTGDFLPILRKQVGQKGRVMGVDFCLPMLELAPTKEPTAQLALGDACRLPLRAESFDGVTVGWGIRNVPDIDQAHAEICRLLKPGGRFVSVDMAIPRNPLMRPIAKVTTNTLLPLLGRLFGKREAYTYLPKSTSQFLSRDELKTSMERAGFVNVSYKDLFFGNICVHWGSKP
jgi:demethylmenaquinone methyltransferase / 2-methoxy-6-polyprenyl-1,4-benzoquinol methylase